MTTVVASVVLKCVVVGTGVGVGTGIEAGAAVSNSKVAISSVVIVVVVGLARLASRASRRARTVAKVVRMWSGNGLVFSRHHAISMSRSWVSCHSTLIFVRIAVLVARSMTVWLAVNG